MGDNNTANGSTVASDIKSPSPQKNGLSIPIAPSIESKTPRRVKVYLLQGEDWLDNGTGYCLGEVDTDTKKPCFVVRNELDSQEVILKSFLEGSIQYQRQQETLIVWTDLSGKDLALSFQENEGCADLCDFIVRAQQENLSPLISLYYVLSTLQDSASDGPREITELVTGPISFPPDDPTKEAMEDIVEVVNQGSNSQYTRSSILKFFVETKYLQKMLALFKEAEDLQDPTTLHFLSDIIKILLVYNEPALLEEFVASEENVLAFVGLLEYDRDYPNFKACHREYLLDETRFKTVVELPTPPDSCGTKMSIFRRDFILNYLKNVVLARSLDDQTLNSLSTMIHSNQMDIINFLKDSLANNNFLGRLFLLYDDDDSLLTSRRDGVRMLHQYVLVTKGQYNSLKTGFFSALVKGGLFKMIKFALRDSDSDIRVVGTELLVTVIEQYVSLVNTVPCEENSHVDELEPPDSNDPRRQPIEEADSSTDTDTEPLKLRFLNDMSLTLVLGRLLLDDKNLGLKIQAYEAIKTLLCSALATGSIDDPERGPKVNGCEASVDHEGNTKYLQAFYTQVAPILFKDFADLGGNDEEKAKEAEEKMASDPILYQHLCDLTSFCCHEHELQICRPFFLENNVLRGILKVLNLKVNVTLKLGVMRCFKSIILLKDYVFYRYIMDNDLFESYFEFFRSVLSENSLANSLCLDLLEIVIRRSAGKSFRQLAIHIYKGYKPFLENQLNYVSTGRDLIQTVEGFMLQDPTATSIDNEQENYNDRNNPSSPIKEEEDEKEEQSHNNLFEKIEMEIATGKRQREDGKDTDAEASEKESQSAVSGESTNARKKVNVC